MIPHPRPLASTLLAISEDDDDDEYYVTILPTIPYENANEAEHNTSGFCGNMSHECHENGELINELHQAVLNGEVSRGDANRIYRGKTL